MQNRCPKCGTTLPEGVPAWTRQLTVADAMSRNPVTLGPEDSLSRGQEVMRRHGVRRIPIMLGDALVGLLAEGDLKRAQPSALAATEEEFRRVMEGTTVSRIMIEKPVTVEEATPLLDAARTLHSTKFGALPVLKDGMLTGMLTDTDLHRSLVELLEQGG
jgi:acetoin utilization protein AcuB